MTTADRALAHNGQGFIASADPGAGIVVLARGHGRAQALANALPAAIESAVFESVPAEPGTEAASWPAPVRSVISFLGALHHDLRTGATHGGRSGVTTPDSLDVLVAIAAGDRMHVVVAGEVVGFRGHRDQWERLAPLGERARRALGLDPRARIEVTSEPYAPGDLFLALPDAGDHTAVSLAVAPPFAVSHAIALWAVAENGFTPDGALGPYAAFVWAPPAPAGELPADESALDLDELDELTELAPLEELTELSEPELAVEFAGNLDELASFEELSELPEPPAEPVMPPRPMFAPRPAQAITPPPPPPPLMSKAVSSLAATPVPPTRSAPPPPPPAVAPTPVRPAQGVLPAWLLERAAKDVEQGARGDQLVPAPAEGLPLADELERPAVDLNERRRSLRRPLMLGGIALALIVPIGLGLGWRPAKHLAALLPSSGHGKPEAKGTPGPIQAGAGAALGPGANDLVSGGRPWQRVVTGALAESQAHAGDAPTGDPVLEGEGRIEARTEPFIAGVTVTVDGKAIGKAPVSLDGIAAGKHLVGFDGGNGRRWEEEVNVMPNEVASAVAPLGAPETQGMVEVVATRMHDDGPSDEEVEVTVDGEVRGATPLDLKLDPGTHGVALELGSGRTIYRVIEVRAGDKQVLDVPIDAPQPFVIEHRPAATLAADGTVILTVQVKGPSAAATYLNLNVEEDGAFKAYPMGPVPGAPGTYAVGLPISRELHGKRLRYYFATAAEGETPIVSKIFVVPLR